MGAAHWSGPLYFWNIQAPSGALPERKGKQAPAPPASPRCLDQPAALGGSACPVAPSGHRFKYPLLYLEAGRRMVGFDNERGKGDHKHVGDQEQPYTFVDVERLIDDFILEVEQWKSGP